MRDWGDEEAVLLEMFPDVAVDVVLDALDFCNGNRNDAILLLSKQNRFKVINDNDGNNENETLESTDTNETNFEDDEDIEDEDLIRENENDENRHHFTRVPIMGMDMNSFDSGMGMNSSTLNDDETESSESVSTSASASASPRNNGYRSDSPAMESPHYQDQSGYKPLLWQSVNPSNPKRDSNSHLLTHAPLPQNPTWTPTLPTKTMEVRNNLPPINPRNSSTISGDTKLEVHVVGAVKNGSYVEYIVEVIVPEEQFMVYRRYSHFHSFNNKLQKLGLANPSKNVMPPKAIKGVKSEGLVSKRIAGLNRYLESLVEQNTDLFLTNPIGKSFIDRNIPSALYDKHV